MKNISTLCLIVLFLSMSKMTCGQEKAIHLILSIDKYSNIAQSCSKDEINVNNWISKVSDYTELRKKVYDLAFSKDKVQSFLSSFECDSNDVILFYYSGHGFRYRNQEIKWPYLYVSNQDETVNEAGLSLEWVKKELIKKGARLVIVFADCCNNIIPIDIPAETDYVQLRTNYNKLFMNVKGHVIASSSVPSQYSYGTSIGGMFTNSFLKSVDEFLGYDQSKITWPQLLEMTKKETLKISSNRQKPQFEFLLEPHDSSIPSNTVLPDKN